MGGGLEGVQRGALDWAWGAWGGGGGLIRGLREWAQMWAERGLRWGFIWCLHWAQSVLRVGLEFA
jgi:hypothetical protein